MEKTLLEFTASGTVREAKVSVSGALLEDHKVGRIHVLQGGGFHTLSRRKKYWRIFLKWNKRAADYTPVKKKQILGFAYETKLETHYTGEAVVEPKQVLLAGIEARAAERQAGQVGQRQDRGATVTLWIARTFMVIGVSFAILAILVVAPELGARWGIGA